MGFPRCVAGEAPRTFDQPTSPSTTKEPRIADLDRGHLAAAGLGHVDVLPVSSLLRQEALATSSKALNEESGYPALLRFLNESVIAEAQQVAVRTAVSRWCSPSIRSRRRSTS